MFSATALIVFIAASGLGSVDAGMEKIASSRRRNSWDPKILERAFNRRGLAYMSLNQFAEAANDFTAVIRLNPRIARLKKKVKGVEEISPLPRTRRFRVLVGAMRGFARSISIAWQRDGRESHQSTVSL